MKAFAFERSSTPRGLVWDTNRHDMTWRGKALFAILFFFTWKLVILYIIDVNRLKKARQSEKKKTPSETKKRKKAESKTGHLMNYFCLFVFVCLILINSVPYECSIVFPKSGTPDVLQGKSVSVSSFHQISKLNLESQRIERQLREELSSKCEVFY